MELRNSVAILTGASRGIGTHLAESLARRGVDIALAARSAGDLEKTAEVVRRVGARAITVPTDVTKLAELEELVRRAEVELGPVDLLVNNAGIERYAYYESSDVDSIDAIMRTNVIGPQILSRLVLPGMVERRRGHIVNISSVAGKTAVPFNVIYSSSKHALVGFSWSLREEMRRHNVGVSVVCPGFVSDAGMYHDWSGGTPPPKVAKTVSPAKVVEKTIEAIEKNKAEVVVAGGLLPWADIFAAFSPEIPAAIGRKSGSYDYLEKEARKSRSDG